PRHVTGKKVVRQDHMRTDREGGRQLAESRIEAQWQCSKKDVLGSIAEIRGHALSTSNQVAVAEHYALGLARAARGVQDRGDVKIDSARRCRRAIRSAKLLPAMHPVVPGRVCHLNWGSDEPDVFDCRTGRECVA